jgi:predicted small lipoprotein YifL
MLAACGQKGPLIGVKPVVPAAAGELAPDAAIAAPASVPASTPAQRP